MSLPLSYLGIRCVLEYLEAVKRAHIIGRAPGLQKVDKLIPLCLGNLTIGTNCFNNKLKINTLSITCEKNGVVLEMSRKRFSRQRAESREEKMKKFVHFYISGRAKILVDKFQLSSRSQYHSSLPDFMPANLKIRVNSLDAFSDFETAIIFIDHRSFPLITLDTTIASTSTFDIPVVKSAETLNLTLLYNEIVTVKDLKKLKNKKKVFKCLGDPRIDIVTLIKYHIRTKKDIRTPFVISHCYKSFISGVLSEFEVAFKEFRCDLDGVNERFIPGSPRFSIPINNRSRIQVYAIEDPKEGPYKIIVKPVSGH